MYSSARKAQRERRRQEAARYLSLLAKGAPCGALADVRWRARGRSSMAQGFYLLESPRLPSLLVALSARSDVYLGVAPRLVRGGGRGALGRSHLVWADCDGEDAVAALSALPPASMLVASGSGAHRHAYWRVEVALTPAQLAQANKRLAAALRADRGAVTNPATILRPAGTLNHKRQPPAPVALVRFSPERSYAREELLDPLPALPAPLYPRGERRRRAREDPLLGLSPREYVRLLTGEPVPAHGKVRCPLHDDRNASLHAWREPERGWFCFGCNRGGDIYRLAELMWGIPARGQGFLELRRRLLRLCGLEQEAA
jgi:hypothetical protein